MTHAELWNMKNLQAPPVTTSKTSFVDIIPLRKHFQNALEYFENLKILEQEAALLSRCIYRMKTKLRRDKGLKSMEKLNRALLQLNYVNMHTVLSDFMSLLPEDESGELYLPSQNMLDYVLVRLQGVTCLMQRAIETAHIAASCMGSRICIGHLWKVALIVLGVVSRIWFLCKDIIKYCCNFYKNIKSIRNLLKNTGSNWLPDQYNLPECLATWLDIDWITLKEASYQMEAKIPFFDVVDSSDVEECGSYIEIKDNVDAVIHLNDEDKSMNDEDTIKADIFERLMRNNDIGEVVSYSKHLNNTVINLSTDSEYDSAEDFEVTELNNIMKSNIKEDKSERLFRTYGWQESANEMHDEGKYINLNNEMEQQTKKGLYNRRTGYINVRDNANDISDNDNSESIEKLNKPNALKQSIRNDSLSQVVSSSLLHIKQSANAVINLSDGSEDDEKNQAYTKTEQLHTENRSEKKKRKKKLRLSKKEHKHEVINVKQVTFFKKDGTMMENEDNVTSTTLKPSIKRDKSSKNSIQIIDHLNSIKKLKNFMSNLEDFNLLGGFHKVDKLQLVMLRKIIKKYTNQAKKELISNSECLLKAKKVLKVTFFK